LKVLITGGAGYIGSVAAHRLIDRGANVVVVDNLAHGHLAALPCGAAWEHADIVDRDTILAVMLAHRPDAVLHFAALTIAPESVRNPAPYWRANAGGTVTLLDAMRDAAVPVIVASSTAAVYGVPTTIPIVEDEPLAPINPYGASKLAAEMAIRSYGEAYGISFALLRYFNVAGAAANAGEDHRPETHLIPNAIAAALGKRDALTIFGTDFPTKDGTAIRDYVHVEDLVDAHLHAIDALLDTRQSLPPLNLGTREGASVRDVVGAVERVTGLSVPVVYQDRRPGDPPVLVADARRASAILGWTPMRSTLEQMIDSAWRWQLRYPDGYKTQTWSG
jgi:UDP-glucose 4-epimerase